MSIFAFTSRHVHALTLWALAAFSGLSIPGAAYALDLAGVYRAALENNTQFRAAEAQYAAARERISQSRAALLPAVSATGNTTWNDNHSNIYGHQRYNSNGYTVTLTQPLFNAPALLDLDEAHLLVEQAKAQFAQVQEDLALRTAQAYFDVLLAEDALATFKAQGAATLEQLQQAKRSLDIGTVNVTDVGDAQARFDLITAQEISARNDVLSKSNTLRQIVAIDPGALAPLPRDVVLTAPEPATLPPWERAAEANNATAAAARAALAAATAEVRKVRNTYLPTIDLVATHGENNSAYSIDVGNQNRGNTVGVQFTVSLFAGGATMSHLREAHLLEKKADADLEEAQRNGVLAAQQAFLGATSGLAQVSALSHALESAHTALKANQRGLVVGTRIDIDVLNARQQTAVIERDLARSRYDTLMSMLRLKAAAGALGAADIDEINALLVH
jgi:outer membrane protein